MPGYHLEEIVVLRKGGEIVFAREGFIVKQMKNVRPKILKLIIDKKEVVHPFCTKTIISNEICILLDKILG